MVQDTTNFKNIEHLSILAWIVENTIKTESGKDLDFFTHRYLLDIYRDNSPLLCCLKAGQIGFSTMAIIKTVWLSYYKKMRIGYVLPTADMSQKFVGSKVNPIIQQNKVLQTWMRDKDAIEQKQVGEGFIHYLGAQTPTAGIMLTMDMLILDEYDKAPQSILETFNSRLQHSEYKWKWIFSNPTVPDFGVDKSWNMSDKKMWHVKHLGKCYRGDNPFANIDQLPCKPGCGKIFVFDESCIDYTQEKFICPYCKVEISDEDRRMGEWIATADGKWSGYWIPLWINPMISVAEICEYKRSSTPEYFYNFVAGLPYINTTNMLSQQILESNLIDKVNQQEGRIIIGADTGHNIYYTLANKDGIFHYGYCPSVAENPTVGYDPYDTLDKLLQRFPRSILISDQGGDLIGIRKLQNKYRGRVFLCWFVKEQRNQQIIKWAENDEEGKVMADRNRLMQLVVDEFKEQRSPIWGKLSEWQDWFNHALNIYKVKEITGEETDPQYGWRWVWKRKGDDHWFLSYCYARIGLDRFANDLATIIHKESIIGNIPKAFNGSITTPDLDAIGFREDF